MKRNSLVSLLGAVVLFGASVCRAEIKTQAIDYNEGGTQLQGYLAYDDAITGKRPGILIAPEWWGLNDYPRHRAEQLAKLGYVAFAIDMYGKGVVAKNPAEAGQLSGPWGADREKTRARALAGLDILKKQEQCDNSKLGAIGYCFGGMVVLELARAGTDLSAVVAFHGALATPHPEQDKPIKPKVLICTGADDAFVPPAQVNALEDEMKKANANYEINVYSGAVHAFTNPDAAKAGMPNVAYNEQADRRSWAAMKQVFEESFAPSAAK